MEKICRDDIFNFQCCTQKRTHVKDILEATSIETPGTTELNQSPASKGPESLSSSEPLPKLLSNGFLAHS